MADGEEEENTNFISRDILIEWERIQLPPIHDQFKSQSPSPPLSDPHVGEGIRLIHEDPQPSIVFPPINHEGLQLHNHRDVQQIDIERARPPSPVSSPRPRTAAMGESVAVGWWDAGVEVLHCKFAGVFSCLRKFSMTRVGLLKSHHFPVAGSIVLLLLLYLKFRHRRRLRSEGTVELIRIIKEKDERIQQLLHQIARMNEILLATHHGVPMISKAVSA